MPRHLRVGWWKRPASQSQARPRSVSSRDGRNNRRGRRDIDELWRFSRQAIPQLLGMEQSTVSRAAEQGIWFSYAPPAQHQSALRLTNARCGPWREIRDRGCRSRRRPTRRRLLGVAPYTLGTSGGYWQPICHPWFATNRHTLSALSHYFFAFCSASRVRAEMP